MGSADDPIWEVVVVGAGAAGLATAIFTQRQSGTTSIRLLDTARKPGAKILVSGGSRCNVTNAIVSEADYWGGRRTIIRRVLRALPVADTVAFFGDLGVPLREEADGKLFPVSNRSRDVLEALLREVERLGVPIDAGRRVVAVRPTPEGFLLDTSRGPLAARIVVLATGGRSLPKTGSDGAGLEMARLLGHTIVPTTPALAPLVLDPTDGFAPGLSGVSLETELTVRDGGAPAARLRGALLWTHFGVSGPVALNASRHWERAQLHEGGGHGRVQVTANLRPGHRFEQVDAMLASLPARRARASVGAALGEWLPASVAAAALHRLGVSAELGMAQLTREHRRRIAHALVEWPLPVVATRGYNFAEATAGGVDLTEIDPSSMESRVCSGLFLTGEMLDVDGRIGGFNFQWAWASAAVAARGIVRRLRT